MQFWLSILTLFLSSVYVLLLDHIAFSSRSLQKALVAIIITLLFVLYRYARHSWKEISTWYGKMFFVFWGTTLVQLLVIATGGFQSPFLVMIHFFMIGLSFIFSFSLAVFFLFSCLIVLFIDVSFSPNAFALLVNDPGLTLLQFASLLVIIPIAYIISRQYHMKDALAGALRAKIQTTEAIIQSLPELIIVTDEYFKILSTNDATVRTLQRSRSELLDKPLFDILLLKDKNNKLVTSKTFFPNENMTSQPIKNLETFTLITSPVLQRNVTMQAQLMGKTTTNSKQISFIISFTTVAENTLPVVFDKARAKYEGLVEDIKQKLALADTKTIKTDMLLLEKIERDTYVLQTLKEILRENNTARIDIAQLCKQTTLLNKEFTNELHVRTQFRLPNFGEKDIAPLTVRNYPVKPEQLTGPFFTASCNVKQIELVIHKLFDMSIFLASREKNATVTISVERKEPESILVIITGSCPQLTEKDLDDLFIPYYGNLENKTDLSLGSGLEGYIVKHMSDTLKIPLTNNYQKIPQPTLTFTLAITKKPSSHH
ncbi:MAG TPA: PAS domain-containing protein [Methylomirabilota bacterium]|nr:PAS domain-containing protein [Methylomirabilota bacterium]